MYFALKTDYDNRNTMRHINNVEDAATHLKPVFREAKAKLEAIYAAHFLTNGGGTWKPLDPQYGAWKASRFPGAPTLFRTGKLFQAVSDLAVESIDDMSASFYVNSPIADFHQYGTWSMPKREIIFEPPMFAREFAQDVIEHVKRKL